MRIVYVYIITCESFGSLNRTGPGNRARGSAVATVITGTNTDKIDQLTQQVTDLKATLRICTWIMGMGFPVMVSLLAFLVAKTIDNSARLEQANYRLESLKEIEKDIKDLRERVIKIEAAQGKK